MDRSPPPFFNQGPSAHARLIFFSLLAIALLVVDSRMNTLKALRQGVGTALYPLQWALLLPRDGVKLVSGYFGDVTQLRAENMEMRRVETANAKALLQAEQLAAENSRLRELLGARERTTVRSVVADVLYDSRDPFTRKLVLDKGLQAGVLPGQPVIDAKGLIGQVTRAFEFSSEVTLVTDRQATIPVELQRNGLRSVAFGAGPGQMELRYLGPTTEIKVNDVLVTSGLDNVYPPGIPVGRIRKVERGPEHAFTRVLIDPLAGAEQTKTLLVLLIEKSVLPAATPVDAGPPSRKRK